MTIGSTFTCSGKAHLDKRKKVNPKQHANKFLSLWKINNKQDIPSIQGQKSQPNKPTKNKVYILQTIPSSTQSEVFFMDGCKKCCKVCGVLMLLLGALFLLVDFGVWDFWGIHWWSAILILFGIGSIAKSGCADCQAMCGGKGKK